MARIQHLAIASLDPEKQAAFYKEVFGFEEVKRIDNPRARGVVLTDGAINISVLNFKQDQIDQGLDYTGLHHFGVFVEDLEGTAEKCLTNGAVPYSELPAEAVRQVQGAGKQPVRYCRSSLDRGGLVKGRCRIGLGTESGVGRAIRRQEHGLTDSMPSATVAAGQDHPIRGWLFCSTGGG